VSTQLRLKLDALRGGGPRSPGVAAPAVELKSASEHPGAWVQSPSPSTLGFAWDGARSLWVRRSRLRLSELGLSSEATSVPKLHSLSPAVDGPLSGPLVCFDLETTGLQRGTGTVPFLYGWASVMGVDVEVEQWLLPDLGEEEALVEAAHEVLLGAGLVVTYNGASFDMPLLRTRAVMTGLERAWPATPHLDLLPLVRRLFRHRLSRCSLKRAEEELLRRPRLDDVSGSEAPERYRRFLRDGDTESLAPVLEHNRLDLLSLLRLIDYLEVHLEKSPPHPADWYSLGRYAEDRGHLQRADALYLGAQAASPPPLDRAAALRRTRLLRRQGRDGEASSAWREIWDRWRDPEAAEALCIDMEHRQGDPGAALDLAQEALRTAPVGWDRRFAKRIWRLQSRLHSRRRDGEVPSRPDGGAELDTSGRPWAAWLPGGTSYEAWLVLRRGRVPAPQVDVGARRIQLATVPELPGHRR